MQAEKVAKKLKANAVSGYSNDSNPFGDPNLTEKYVNFSLQHFSNFSYLGKGFGLKFVQSLACVRKKQQPPNSALGVEGKLVESGAVGGSSYIVHHSLMLE